MPHPRRLSRLPSHARVTLRVTTEQRNLLLGASAVPKDLGYLLAHAAVRNGKLAVQLNREGLDRLIVTASRVRVPDKAADRELVGFLAYLESIADRFEAPDDEINDAASGD